MSSADEPFCSSWILMSGMRLWPKGQLTIMYGLALAYCFLGVAIIADVFMGAIEVITSKSVTYNRVNEDTGEEEEVTVQFWNPTVANLSLMALGSSAPEILLAVIGTFATLDGTPDVLGPATIVGSAAFNLLVICAICIAAIPDGEFRRINQMSVYTITATCSVFAYVWLFIVLSDEVVKAWEAWLTFMMFWILLVVAWAADNNFWRGDALGDKGGDGSENLEGSRRPSFSSNMPSASAINAVDISIQGKDQHLHMGEMAMSGACIADVDSDLALVDPC
jgi:solute carrier family 8 (sodium/calcium exchanger)